MPTLPTSKSPVPKPPYRFKLNGQGIAIRTPLSAIHQFVGKFTTGAAHKNSPTDVLCGILTSERWASTRAIMNVEAMLRPQGSGRWSCKALTYCLLFSLIVK